MCCGLMYERREEEEKKEEKTNGMKRMNKKDAKIVMGSIKNLNLLKKWLRAFACINFIFIGK